MSQIQIVLSKEPEMIQLPLDENMTYKTLLVCPSNGPKTSSPISESQTWMVLSQEPEMICLLLGENATEQIALVHMSYQWP